MQIEAIEENTTNPYETMALGTIAMDATPRSAITRSADHSSVNPNTRMDTLTLSDAARAAAYPELPGAVRNDNTAIERREQEDDADQRREDDQKQTKPSEDDEPEAQDQELTEEEKREVEELRQTDQKVRAHEQAHAAAGATNVRYDYQTGPDGRQYAVGGTADISAQAPAGDHDSKLEQARKMKAAALAPADPSPQDMAVAAKAARLELEAVQEKTEAEREEPA